MKFRALIAHCGSLQTTLACMGLFAALLGVRITSGALPAVALAVTLGALVLNLLMALIVHPAFRRQLPLLVAHLALLAVALLAGLGRLTALEGRFELTQGVPFDGQLMDGAAGPWYRGGLNRIAFTHEGFEIDYAAGRKRGPTRNTVSWVDADGTARSAIIGDHHPLVLDGYRIYTSPNKGFAPVLTWRPERGEPVRGAVHLPSFPAQELHQSREWTLPDGRTVWVMLQIDENLLDPKVATPFRLPSEQRLVVRSGDRRAELRPGEQFALAGGVLSYDVLSTWMGYRVSFDPTLPWLLAAALLASLGFAWHYQQKFRAQPAAAAAALRQHMGAWAEAHDG